jgi:hypothetical protein
MHKEFLQNHRTMSKTITISNGASREELFDGLRLFSEKRETSFLIENNGRQIALPVVMQSIQAEDGSGHSWNITFVIEVQTLLMLSLPVDVRTVFAGKKAIIAKAYYSTKNRKGAITLI